ncbi:MAG: polysaccharide pyruvyl transferase CsaB [Armatimonadetes bacterium]|nr:polysaccharide pyruvyl transferase CsaB [Armatimonadota bacterium]
MPTRLLLAGYFGCGNLGDDAIMLGYSQGFDSKQFDITALSGAPEETFRNYGIPSVGRKDFPKIKEAISKCDALVLPGGSIFQDVTSTRSAYYYLNLVRQAKNSGKKVFLLGQGVGPVRKFFGRRWTAQAYNMADLITVRDPASMTLLKELGVTKPIRVTADSALLLGAPVGTEDSQGFAVGQMKTVGISVRPHGKGDTVVKLFADLARLLFQNGYMPVMIEMDRNEDGPMILEVARLNGGKVPDIRKLQTPQQLQQRLSRMDGVIAMRLHAGILAASVGVTPFMVSYDPKVTAFGRLLDVPAPGFEGMTAQRLYEQFVAFQKQRVGRDEFTMKKVDELRAAAAMNVTYTLEACGVRTPAGVA